MLQVNSRELQHIIVQKAKHSDYPLPTTSLQSQQTKKAMLFATAYIFVPEYKWQWQKVVTIAPKLLHSIRNQENSSPGIDNDPSSKILE